MVVTISKTENKIAFREPNEKGFVDYYGFTKREVLKWTNESFDVISNYINERATVICARKNTQLLTRCDSSPI